MSRTTRLTIGESAGPLPSVRLAGGTLLAVPWSEVVDPPADRWTPADLPTGFISPSDYLDYLNAAPSEEIPYFYDTALLVTPTDLGLSGTTNLRTLKNAVTGNKYLALPPGTYTWSDFSDVNFAGCQIGKSGATGCLGIVGSGRGQTILKMVDNSSTKAGAYIGSLFSNNLYPGSGGTNETNQIVVQGGGSWTAGALIANLTLQGSQQPHYYNGLRFYNCSAPLAAGLELLGASPGFNGAPPGETFGINMYQSPNATIWECDIDGRDANTAAGAYYAGRTVGDRICASPFGWNNTSNANVYRTYVHHGYSGMPTWWITNGVYTEDLISYSTGSGTGNRSGAGFNHEDASGVIMHVRPTMKPAGTQATDDPLRTSNNGQHMTAQMSVTDAQITLIEPIYDRGSYGVFNIYTDLPNYRGVSQKLRSWPIIVENGVTLEVRQRYCTFINTPAGVSAGSYVLNVAGTNTSSIAYNASNATLQAAVNAALSGTTCVVVGTQVRREVRWQDKADRSLTLASQSVTGGTITTTRWDAGLTRGQHAVLGF